MRVPAFVVVALVVAAPAAHAQIAGFTARDGSYRCDLGTGGYSMVYAFGNVKISGRAAIGTLGPDGKETIEIREAVPPSVPADPQVDIAAIPDYTQRAIERDEWVRAWLVLDVDERGTDTAARPRRAGNAPNAGVMRPTRSCNASDARRSTMASPASKPWHAKHTLTLALSTLSLGCALGSAPLSNATNATASATSCRRRSGTLL